MLQNIDFKYFNKCAEAIQSTFTPDELVDFLTNIADSAHTFFSRNTNEEYKSLDSHYFINRLIQEVAFKYRDGKKQSRKAMADALEGIYGDEGKEGILEALGGIMLSVGDGFAGSFPADYLLDLHKRGISMLYEICYMIEVGSVKSKS